VKPDKERDSKQDERESDVETVFAIIKDSLAHLLTKPGIILISTFLALVLWGPKGRPVFTPLFKDWIVGDLGQQNFRLQMLSFGSGVLLLVVVPFVLIKFRFRERLSDYGLGLGDVKLGAAFCGLVLLLSLPLFYFSSRSPQIWAEYPLIYQGMDAAEIKQVFNWSSFLLFEMMYVSFFFVIEFTFRGYMLFGLEQQFGRYTVLIQMLSYTAWHLPKPTGELLGTPVFGFAVAAVTLRLRSVWYVFFAHWLLNIFLDLMILWNRGVI
jgi:hypothetical protein